LLLLETFIFESVEITAWVFITCLDHILEP